MKKYYLLSLVLAAFFFGIFWVRAHPLDISNTVFTLQEKSILGTTYLHSFEGQYLASQIKKEPVYDFQSVFTFEKQILEYVGNHISVQNDQKVCRFVPKRMVLKDDYQLLASGFEIEYLLDCPDELNNLAISNTLFIKDFELQTNKMQIYALESANFTLKRSKVFNRDITSFAWNVHEDTSLTIKDTDKDGVSDDDERSFKTDPKKGDTDNDNYSDFEEIQFSWNPIDPTPGPGQQLRESAPEEPKDRTPQVGFLEIFLEKVFLWLLKLIE